MEYFDAMKSIAQSLVAASSYTSTSEDHRHQKIIHLVDGSAGEWLSLIRKYYPSWPSINDEEHSLAPAEVRHAIASIIIAYYCNMKAKWPRLLLLTSQPQLLTRAFARDILQDLKVYFTADSSYQLRALQLEFKEKLQLVGPKTGFMTQYLKENDEVDIDLEFLDSSKKLWKNCTGIVTAFHCTVCSIEDSNVLFSLKPLILAPLFQILDDSSSDHLNPSIQVSLHLVKRFNSEQLNHNFCMSVLMEAVLNRYWVWSIGGFRDLSENANVSIISDILETLDIMIEKDFHHRGHTLEVEHELYFNYMESRKRLESEGKLKKSSRTRIEPNSPWLVKVDQIWCQVLQIAQTITPLSLKRIHAKIIIRYINVYLKSQIKRNFKSLLKFISIYSVSADVDLTLILYQLLRDCMKHFCKKEIAKYEGDILVLLVDFGNQLASSELRTALGEKKHSILMSELRKCLDVLIDLLVEYDEIETIIADWTALKEVTKINVKWALPSFERLIGYENEMLR